MLLKQAVLPKRVQNMAAEVGRAARKWQKVASDTGCVALKCHKTSSQNTLCRPKVPKTAP